MNPIVKALHNLEYRCKVKEYRWPKNYNARCPVPLQHVLLALPIPDTSSRRGYKFKADIHKKIDVIFKNFTKINS